MLGALSLCLVFSSQPTDGAASFITVPFFPYETSKHLRIPLFHLFRYPRPLHPSQQSFFLLNSPVTPTTSFRIFQYSVFRAPLSRKAPQRSSPKRIADLLFVESRFASFPPFFFRQLNGYSPPCFFFLPQFQLMRVPLSKTGFLLPFWSPSCLVSLPRLFSSVIFFPLPSDSCDARFYYCGVPNLPS